MNLFMAGATFVELQEFEHPLLRFRIGLSGQYKLLLDKIKEISFSLAIDRPAVQQLERRGKLIVGEIFSALAERPDQLIPSWDEGLVEFSVERRICDYVAGMTDGYAEKVYQRLFVPGFGSSRDEL